MTVKILLKQVRNSRKLSQNKLAQLVGMTLQNIQRIEYGDAKSIPLETLDKLCEVLDCQPGDLLIRVPDGESERTFSVKLNKSQELKPGKASADETPSSQGRHHYPLVRSLPEILESD
ncbi:MAG: helix-turn-helix domain-containing protein [Microcystaceae cyanobacterium]